MYTSQPKLPPEIAELYETILKALNGAMPVTEAAQKLGISAVQCHNLLNRAAAGILEALLPKRPGRKAMPQVERKLREENERLKKENARLEDRVAMVERLMAAVGGIMRGQVRPFRTKKKKEEGGGNEPEEPDGAVRAKMQEYERLRGLGMTAMLAAALAGVSAATMRRWRARVSRGERACARRGPARRSALSVEKKEEVVQAVRGLHGVCGAAALAKVTGVSRRQAARVKSEVMTELERERIARCARLMIAEPGVMRSMDQLYIGEQIALLASDASVPYRTSAQLVAGYTASEVARVLASDFEKHGAPLVVRMDRASPHDAAPVREVLREHQVLMLHGPARYPQYYGQHERQNREHRAWLAHSASIDDDELGQMLRVLNERWPRRSLGWRCAAEVWNARRQLRTNRRELRHDVVRQLSLLRARLGTSRCAMRLAERLAIEQALEDRGLVRRIPGGW